MDYSNICKSLRDLTINAASKNFDINLEGLNIAIEVPKDSAHGHLSTNAAMIIASKVKENPREVAEKIKKGLSEIDFFVKIEVAGSGFINFTMKPNFWHNSLLEILNNKNFGSNNHGKGEKVNIEFVSANPTGPMHIGHARGAVYGDVLARVMKASGFEVTKEYYVNDAGSQIIKLTDSAMLRYREACGEEIEIPDGMYPGEYLKIVGQNLKEKYGNNLEISEGNYKEIKKFVVEKMLDMIRDDLAKLKIKHDVFVSEDGLSIDLTTLFQELQQNGIVYKGTLPAPKGEIDPDWVPHEHLIFKSTNYGDDQDRSISKQEGWTYFAGDIIYANDKVERGFYNNIIVLGADHIGYVKRLKAAYKAVSDNKANAEIILCQLVNFMEDGKPIKMSKRAGNFTTVADVINEVGSDVLRFVMLTRKNDVILDFDLDLVKSQTKENPVFYVQYAQVRANSVLENAKENFKDIYKLYESINDFSMINSDVELELIRDLSLFPKLIASIAETKELHKLPYYLQDISSKFHSLWNLGKEDDSFKFIREDAKDLSAARLKLIEAFRIVVVKGLELIGVEPYSKM